MANKFSLYNITDLVHTFTGNSPGTAPDGAVSTSSARIQWNNVSGGGLIDLADLGNEGPMRVVRVVLFMAGQATWSLNLLDGTNSLVLASGTTQTSYTAEALAYLIGGQKLQLVTTGGTTAVKMVVTVADARSQMPAPRGV